MSKRLPENPTTIQIAAWLARLFDKPWPPPETPKDE